ncbi:Trehalose-6-P synthase/phosphatase complex synthase subunit [Cladochytrium tenue]|nr:Trehalose-6-P synthase/phosphatase complex synthase subunit [Cladochytrium tenue]
MPTKLSQVLRSWRASFSRGRQREAKSPEDRATAATSTTAASGPTAASYSSVGTDDNSERVEHASASAATLVTASASAETPTAQTLLLSPEDEHPTNRLIMVSNRLPITIKRDESAWTYAMSSGDIDFNEEHWDAYREANMAFAEALASTVQDGDLVWVHDYQLMLLPSLLRSKLPDKPNVKIGFFLHIPFPSSEIYRILPVRREVLQGVLQSDLIGFHTVEYEGRTVKVGTFPIGIDPEKFTKGVELPAVQARISALKDRFKDIKIFVGVDRLDYIKGRVQTENDITRPIELPLTFVRKTFDEAKKRRVLFFDYDGTLAPAGLNPEYAAPTKTLLDMLKRASDLPNVYIYIISGRSRFHLDNWFRDVGVGLSAEHGCFYKHPRKFVEGLGHGHDSDLAEYIPSALPYGPPVTNDTADLGDVARLPIGLDLDSTLDDLELRSRSRAALLPRTPSAQSLVNVPELTLRRANEGWLALVNGIDGSWRSVVRPLLRHYVDRTPGSYIEEKEVNLTWHYRDADPEFAMWQAAEMLMNMEHLLNHLPVSIVPGTASLELRPSLADKASAVRAIMKDLGGPGECDFVLCAGDGPTDEPVFEFGNTLSDLGVSVWTTSVGKRRTAASHYVKSVKDVEGLLGLL